MALKRFLITGWVGAFIAFVGIAPYKTSDIALHHLHELDRASTFALYWEPHCKSAALARAAQPRSTFVGIRNILCKHSRAQGLPYPACSNDGRCMPLYTFFNRQMG
jgi:hypothetical protein